MSNGVAIGLAVVVVAAIAADWMWQDGAGALFMARRLVDVIEFLAFWR